LRVGKGSKYAPAASPMLPRKINDKAAFWRPVRSNSNTKKIWSGRRGSNPRPRPWQGRAPARYWPAKHKQQNQISEAQTAKIRSAKHKQQNQIRKRRRAATPRGGIGPKLTTMRCVPLSSSHWIRHCPRSLNSCRKRRANSLQRSTALKYPKRRSKMLLGGFLRSAASAPARWLWSFSGLRLPG